jgi:predicted metal-dependent phosphoesterase TrpH
MSPEMVVRTALDRGLDGIAICDHNSAENVPAFARAAEGTGLTVLAGLEVTSTEEAHLLAIFDSWEKAREVEERVYLNLGGWNNPEVFGWQVVVNEAGEVSGFNPKLLIGATDLSLDELISAIHSRNGLALAAHIDRESYSIVGQLGFIPPELEIDGVELSARAVADGKTAEDYGPGGYPAVTGSDAHKPEDIARTFSILEMERFSLNEVKLALKGEKGRKLILKAFLPSVETVN